MTGAPGGAGTHPLSFTFEFEDQNFMTLQDGEEVVDQADQDAPEMAGDPDKIITLDDILAGDDG